MSHVSKLLGEALKYIITHEDRTIRDASKHLSSIKDSEEVQPASVVLRIQPSTSARILESHPFAEHPDQNPAELLKKLRTVYENALGPDATAGHNANCYYGEVDSLSVLRIILEARKHNIFLTMVDVFRSRTLEDLVIDLSQR